MATDPKKELEDISERIAQLNPSNASELALLGYILGAVYSLRKVIQISKSDYIDEHVNSEFGNTVRDVALRMAKEEEVHPDWLAGYYFNSAIHRIDSLSERVSDYVYRDKGKKSKFSSKVNRDVRLLKHRISGIIEGRKASLSEAINALNLIVKVLISIMSPLK